MPTERRTATPMGSSPRSGTPGTREERIARGVLATAMVPGVSAQDLLALVDAYSAKGMDGAALYEEARATAATRVQLPPLAELRKAVV
jgi:hypothetical protein